MQRVATANTRGPLAVELQFRAYTKECDCIVCGEPGPSIVDHCFGATFKHLKTLIGHWFILPLCPQCDAVKTNGSPKAFRLKFGLLCDYWLIHVSGFEKNPPEDVQKAIIDWGR